MKLRIFQSAKGDCLLLEGSDGSLVLVDGGMANSFRQHVVPHLADLRDEGRELEAVYVSHIDQDHISGVLEMLEIELAWRVFEHHHYRGSRVRTPALGRPPRIKTLWHNAFHDQISKNAGEIENLLAASVTPFIASRDPEIRRSGFALAGVAASVKEAIQVSQLASKDVLGIPLNQVPGNKRTPRLLRADGRLKPFFVGTMRFTILGPTVEELTQLRDGWDFWLGNNRKTIDVLREQSKRDGDEIGNAGIRLWEDQADYKRVTVPNIASLTFLVEDAGKRLLLTGDTHHDMLIHGIERANLFDASDRLHVEVLKVQHHGSEHNLDDEFARRVTADHYVFCGDGSHGNPEPVVLERICRARMTDRTTRPFSFWFSSTSTASLSSAKARTAFQALETEAHALRRTSKGRLSLVFNEGDFVDLAI